MTSTTMIGDLIGSRGSDDRQALHARFERALDEVNARFDPPTPMRMQVGDEYQGVFATLGDALSASLLVRLALHPDGDIRHGIGRGEIEVLGTSPRVEDGPGWWAARAAVERVEENESRAATRTLRTAYVDSSPSAVMDVVNASLLLRDELVTGLSERSLSVLRGLLAGTTQRDLADELGISPSAVSQRVRADGLGTILAAHELLGGLA
ncbi:MAG: SatD family protein [Nocardioides sp.]|uniref:SatD family protein n=1 Tax=Nocardioides sp. TaxID=35761 RepID=UPI00326653FB